MSLSYSYHLSMSLSYSYDPTPATPSPGTTQHIIPTSTPSSPYTIPSDHPSLAPSGSPTNGPTQSIAATGSPTPLSHPASTASPGQVTNNSQHQDLQAFECSTATGIGLAEKTDESASLSLLVGYIVESTSTSTNDFEEALEEQFLMTAVEAAIGCTNSFGGTRAQNLPIRSLASAVGTQSPFKLLAHTTKVGTYAHDCFFCRGFNLVEQRVND
jgi:hypothetical protein